MNPITFLFSIAQQFSPMEDVEFHKNKTKGNEWFMSIMTDEKEPTNKYLAMLKKHGNEWYTALILSLLYIYAMKYLTEFMSTKKTDHDEY